MPLKAFLNKGLNKELKRLSVYRINKEISKRTSETGHETFS